MSKVRTTDEITQPQLLLLVVAPVLEGDDGQDQVPGRDGAEIEAKCLESPGNGRVPANVSCESRETVQDVRQTELRENVLRPTRSHGGAKSSHGGDEFALGEGE